MAKKPITPSKPNKLIAVMGFEKNDNGDLRRVYGPMEFASEERAVSTAKGLTKKYDGVIAFTRDVDPEMGEYGPPTTLYQHGDVPDLE